MIVSDTQTRLARHVAPTGAKPRWLRDGRRVIYTDVGRLWLLDTADGRTRELLALRGESVEEPAVSRDDRWIYFARRRLQGDVWLGTLALR